MKSSLTTLAVILFSLFTQQSQATILPSNNLHLQDNLNILSNITEDQFNRIIDDIMDIYVPVAAAKGVTLTAAKLWSNSTVNASAQQFSATNWKINMYGGLARRSEITPDGFALVVCHELGHHFAGFAFWGPQDWAASEGQSDYFATQSCARRIWRDSLQENAAFRQTVDPHAQAGCDAAWSNVDDQNLCYRSAMAGLSLGRLLAALRSNSVLPRFDTPDPNVVSNTRPEHPAAQCRLDTYYQGGLCSVAFNIDIIPGKNHPSGQGSTQAEAESYLYSCNHRDRHTTGLRPACWYKNRL